MNADTTEKMYADAADNARAEQPQTGSPLGNASEDDFNWDTWWGEYHMDAHNYGS